MFGLRNSWWAQKLMVWGVVWRTVSHSEEGEIGKWTYPHMCWRCGEDVSLLHTLQLWLAGRGRSFPRQLCSHSVLSEGGRGLGIRGLRGYPEPWNELSWRGPIRITGSNPSSQKDTECEFQM